MITVAATGFYGPQGRSLKADKSPFDPLGTLAHFDYDGLRITNFDMETAALYLLGKYFGFRCVTLNTIIANRPKQTFSKSPAAQVDALIELLLSRLKMFH